MAYTPLTEEQIAEQLTRLIGWQTDGTRISKTYTFDKYMEGPAFACAVGAICEGINHHPDLIIGYKRVTISFTTHDTGNTLTEKDFACAAAIEALGYPKPKA